MKLFEARAAAGRSHAGYSRAPIAGRRAAQGLAAAAGLGLRLAPGQIELGIGVVGAQAENGREA